MMQRIRIVLAFLLLHTATTQAQQGWERLDFPGYGGENMRTIASSDGVILAAGEGGIIIHSTDEGKSWEVTSNHREDGNAITGLSIEAQVAIAVGEGGVFLYSEDGGISWAELSPPDSSWFVDGLVSTNDPGRLWGIDQFRGTLISTSDKGGSWKIDTLLPGRVLHAMSEAEDGTLFVGGSGGLLARSTDEGESWEVWINLVNDNIYDLHFTDSLRGWIATGNGISYTENGGKSWTTQLEVGQWGVVHLDFSPTGQGIASGANGVIYRTADGTTWKKEALDSSTSAVVPAYVGDRAVAVGTNGFTAYQEDAGQWKLLGENRRLHMFDLVKAPDGSLWRCGENGLLERSTDRGEEWVVIDSTTGITLIGLGIVGSQVWGVGTGGNVISVEYDGSNLTRHNVGTDSVLVGVARNEETGIWIVGDGVVLHSENGTDWTDITPDSGMLYTGVAAAGDRVVVIGEKGYAAELMKGSATWQQLSTGTTAILYDLFLAPTGELWMVGPAGLYLHRSTPTAPFILDTLEGYDELLALDIVDEGKTQLISSRSGMVHYTFDGGNKWYHSQIDMIARGLAIDDQYLHITGFYRSHWRSVRLTTVVPHLPLHENRGMTILPNPGNGLFRFSMEGELGEGVRLEIIDMMGGIVWSGESIGNHSRGTLDLTHLHSGMYLVRLSMSDQVIAEERLLIVE